MWAIAWANDCEYPAFEKWSAMAGDTNVNIYSEGSARCSKVVVSLCLNQQDSRAKLLGVQGSPRALFRAEAIIVGLLMCLWRLLKAIPSLRPSLHSHSHRNPQSAYFYATYMYEHNYMRVSAMEPVWLQRGVWTCRRPRSDEAARCYIRRGNGQPSQLFVQRSAYIYVLMQCRTTAGSYLVVWLPLTQKRCISSGIGRPTLAGARLCLECPPRSVSCD